MTDNRNDPNKGSPSQNKSFGSDAASTGKVSAGTSVGAERIPGAAHSSVAQGSGQSGQSSTLRHTLRSLPAGSRRAASFPGRPVAEPRRAVRRSAVFGARHRLAGRGAGPERAGEAYDQASDWARDTYERASSWASDALDDRSGRLGRARARSMRRVGDARRGVQHSMSRRIRSWSGSSALRPGSSSARSCRGPAARTKPSANGLTRFASRHAPCSGDDPARPRLRRRYLQWRGSALRPARELKYSRSDTSGCEPPLIASVPEGFSKAPACRRFFLGLVRAAALKGCLTLLCTT